MTTIVDFYEADLADQEWEEIRKLAEHFIDQLPESVKPVDVFKATINAYITYTIFKNSKGPADKLYGH